MQNSLSLKTKTMENEINSHERPLEIQKLISRFQDPLTSLNDLPEFLIKTKNYINNSYLLLKVDPLETKELMNID